MGVFFLWWGGVFRPQSGRIFIENLITGIYDPVGVEDGMNEHFYKYTIPLGLKKEPPCPASRTSATLAPLQRRGILMLFRLRILRRNALRLYNLRHFS